MCAADFKSSVSKRKFGYNLMYNSTSSLVNVAKESREICARNQSGHLQANL